jgi:predicted RND superfamily exporter protein
MEIIGLDKKPKIDQDKKLKNKFVYFEKLINELKKRSIPSDITISVNQYIEEINSFSVSNKDLRKQIRKSQYNILKLIEKELKIVPKNLYRSRWLAIGMSFFGIPFGVAFGVSLDNMAFLGIGIPIGMVIGMAIGAGMDKKAFEEGRQLNLKIKY